MFLGCFSVCSVHSVCFVFSLLVSQKTNLTSLAFRRMLAVATAKTRLKVNEVKLRKKIIPQQTENNGIDGFYIVCPSRSVCFVPFRLFRIIFSSIDLLTYAIALEGQFYSRREIARAL